MMRTFFDDDLSTCWRAPSNFLSCDFTWSARSSDGCAKTRVNAAMRMNTCERVLFMLPGIEQLPSPAVAGDAHPQVSGSVAYVSLLSTRSRRTLRDVRTLFR